MSFEDCIDVVRDWVIAQIYATQAWVNAFNFLQTSYVNRGDPANADWEQGDLTFDSAWHDLDCSAIVPAGAKAIHFGVWHRNTLINKDFYLRKKGNVNQINICEARNQVANIMYFTEFVCACDSNRFVQYWLHAGGAPITRLKIRGWWL